MSLRTLHIVFILLALGLLAFMAYWSGGRVMAGENSMSRAMLAAAVAGLAAGVPYLGWFIGKTRAPRP